MDTKAGSLKNLVGEAIRKFRIMRHMTVKELADKTGIAASNMSAIENGSRSPKLDMCERISEVLKCDPVELCGIQLSDTDEKRLLIKLLSKYAQSVTAVKTSDDQEGIDVRLPVDFLDFENRYNENKANLEAVLNGMSETDPNYELDKATASDWFNYWIDSYPTFDAYTRLKSVARDINFDSINITSDIISEEMKTGFWTYQNEYVLPSRKEALKAKLLDSKTFK